MDLAEIQKLMKSISIDEGDGEDDLELASELEGILSGGETKTKNIKSKISQSALIHDIDKITQEFNFNEKEVEDEIDENLEDDVGLISELENFLSSKAEEKKQTSSENLPLLNSSQHVDKTVPLVPTNLSSSSIVKEIGLTNLPDYESTNKKYTTNNKQHLNNLKNEYKKAALLAKSVKDTKMAINFVKTAKQIDILIDALEKNLPVDMSTLPPLPNYKPSTTSSEATNTYDEENVLEFESVNLTQEDADKLFNAPPPPESLLDALQQRYDKFKETLNQAKAANNTSKARRLGRIVTNYEAAIKACKAGRNYDYDQLPIPPGFADLPSKTELPKASSAVPSPSPTPTVSAPIPAPFRREQPTSISVASEPSKPKLPKVSHEDTTSKTVPEKKSPQAPIRKSLSPRPALKKMSSISEKQLNYLIERKKLFIEASLESKKKGDIQQAKEYLRMAKGFEPLITATEAGLPIDATSIPVPPQMVDDFVVVSRSELPKETDDSERDETYKRLESELQSQIEMCKKNQEHFLSLGDVSSASKFEKLAKDAFKDLDMLRNFWRSGDRVPRFVYETRSFSIVISNTDVSNNELVVDICRGIEYPAKSTVDTYVKVIFPFPNDTHQTFRTHTIKDSINPEYNESFRFTIDRKSRQLARICKRHPLKCEIYSRGGFFRSDALIGIVSVKMQELETKCTIHDSFPLMEGRKVIGGCLEVKIKIREPLLAKQVEEVKEKWLNFL